MLRSAVTGVILAGGRAERLGGIAKGMLEHDGVAIARRIADALAEVASGCLLVADEPGPYATLGLPAIPDAVAGAGPAGGLLAALEHAKTPFVLVVACDMPAVRAPLLSLLRDRDERWDAVVPVVGGLVEPLCARWAVRAAPAFRAALEAGERKMASLLDGFEVERLQEEVLMSVDPELALTDNVNTPADVERLALFPGKGDAMSAQAFPRKRSLRSSIPRAGVADVGRRSPEGRKPRERGGRGACMSVLV